MSRRPRWSLRVKLIVALVGLAILGAGMASLFSTWGLNSRLEAAAEARLQRSAEHYGRLAAVLYRSEGGWTESAADLLGHLASIDELYVELRSVDGAMVIDTLSSQRETDQDTVGVAVRLDGKLIGRLGVAQQGGGLLNEEEQRLRSQLDLLHFLAGLAAALLALLVGLYLGLTLTRPLRRIREAALRMTHGDLSTRVDSGGDREIRDLARALDGLAASLQEEEELRKENVADLAHELRTPVMGLLSRIEAAQDGVLTDIQANLAAMHAEVERLARLLDDLTALADAQRPGMLLEKRRVDLAVVASAVVEMFRLQAAERQVRLETRLAEAPVDADPARLEQVVTNLVSNAVRYTPEGGCVEVRTAVIDGECELDVSDSGIGIPAEDVPNVFKRFWRGDRSRSRDTGGAGIGLAIVQELVDAHGGRISVESELGHGTSFHVFFPISQRSDDGE